MLSVYTRHSADCPRSDDGAWKRCKCPKWVWGTLNDEFIRRSAKTRSWEHAEEFRLDAKDEINQAGGWRIFVRSKRPPRDKSEPEKA